MAYTTIDDPSAHFQIALYTGQGGTATAVTNDGNSDLQPDLIFFKSRTTTARWNVMDSTRGTTKVLYADGNDAQATDAGSEKPGAISPSLSAVIKSPTNNDYINCMA